MKARFYFRRFINVLHPCNDNQLELVGKRSLKVRFRHGDLAWHEGMDVSSVRSNSEIGKVRDACRRSGAVLLLERTSTCNAHGRIFSSESLSRRSPDRISDSNVFNHDLYDHSEYCLPEDEEHFEIRSFGLGKVDIDSSPLLTTWDEVLRFLRIQVKAGYRGLCFIQAKLKDTSARYFIAEIMISDSLALVTLSTESTPLDLEGVKQLQDEIENYW